MYVDCNFELEIKSTIATKTFIMKANMGSIDRIIRIIVALIFFTLTLTGIVEGIAATVLVILGAIFLLTSAVSFCPLYIPFKISTKQ